MGKLRVYRWRGLDLRSEKRPQFVQDAIFVDEVGLQYGRYGEYVVRSAYQPILSKSGDYLAPVAIEGLAAVFKHGRRIPCQEFFAGTCEADKLFIESMCKALHIRNFKPSGIENLDLYFNFDPASYSSLEPAIREIRYMARRLGELGINPKLLVCEITETAAIDDDILLELVRETRRHGIRIAIDDFGSGQSGWERFDLIEPDLVKIDAGWFQRLTAERGTMHLLARLIEQFDARDVPVLIEGIETPLHLQSAIDAGAEHFQGFLFGRPALAGTELSEHPVSLKSLLSAAPLYSLLQSEKRDRMYF